MSEPTLAEALASLLALVLTAAISAVVPRVRAWMRAQEQTLVTSGHELELRFLRLLADQAVAYVEQAGRDWGSAAKQQEASQALREWASQYEIDLGQREALDLVEAAVRVLQASGLERRAADGAKRPTPPRGTDGRFVKRET